MTTSYPENLEGRRTNSVDRPRPVQGRPGDGSGPSLLRRGVDGLGALVRDVDWSLSYVAFLVYLFVIITYRADVADIAMVVALGGLLLEKRLRFPPFLLLFGIFIVWSCVGLADTAYPEAVSEQLLLFIRLWLITLVAVNVLNNWPRIRFVLVLFLLLFATHPARGAILNQYMYGYDVFGRVVWRGSFGNPNDLASLTFLPLGIAAALLRDRNRWIRYGAIASVVVLPLLIVLTQSRGGLLALFLFGILTLLREKRRLHILALVALIGIGVALTAPIGAWERMEDLATAYSAGDVGEADSSVDQRLMVWEVAIAVIQDDPVTGVGLGAYRFAHGEYVAAHPELSPAGGNRDVHSTYLGVLTETGWPGFLVFIWLLTAVVRNSVRTRNQVQGIDSDRLRYLEFSLYGYLFAGLFGTFFHLTFFYLHLALISGLAADIRRRMKLSQAYVRKLSRSDREAAFSTR